ncbi:MAG TPA: hypothetical protein VI643_08310 [Planctomycetota bacterium]|nr:hypothetical protein [Planctomycetota bacterium]
MRLLLAGFATALLIGTLGTASPIQDDPKECCERVEKAWSCPRCDRILDDSDTIDFDIGGGDRGKLKACKLCADKTGKDLRGLYRAAAERVEQCVRVYYECEQCHRFRHSTEECCGKNMTAKTDKARIQYRCEGCGRSSATAMDCPKQPEGARWHCPKEGETLKARCRSAGVFPHGSDGPPPAANPAEYWGGAMRKDGSGK